MSPCHDYTCKLLHETDTCDVADVLPVTAGESAEDSFAPIEVKFAPVSGWKFEGVALKTGHFSTGTPPIAAVLDPALACIARLSKVPQMHYN